MEKTVRDEAEQQEQATKKEQPKEIERKFLITSLPSGFENYPHDEIAQGYIAIAEDGTEIRLRKKGDAFFQTIKRGGGRTRSETEVKIDQQQFEALWNTTEGKRLEKIRYKIPHEKGVIEVDVYKGELAGLVTAEIEFKSGEDSNDFTPPAWFGKETTEDTRYKNQSLALYGLPQEIISIPEYDLENGLEKLSSLVKEKLAQKEGPVIVEIAGGSASGKTSAVAKKIADAFGADAFIFSMDDYYKGKKFMESEAEKGRVLNWDQPEALDLELLQTHLKNLKNNQAIEKPIYSFKTGEPEGAESIHPARIIIIEGLFALNDAVAPEGDIKAFVDIGTHGRILRRILRDIERTGQKPADILKYFSEVVEPMHEKYIQSTRRNADIVIKNEYSPAVEAQRSGLHEIQLKFKTTVDENTLRKAGAERLGAVQQTDYYYNPKDRNLRDTDELLRIRDEVGHKLLTYKGPRIQSEYRQRPKFEFEIDTETEAAFLSIYGDKIKTIHKERTLYQLDGIVFSVDSVKKVESGQETELGTFVEIRSTDKNKDEEKIKEVGSRLGLLFADMTAKSYFEM